MSTALRKEGGQQGSVGAVPHLEEKRSPSAHGFAPWCSHSSPVRAWAGLRDWSLRSTAWEREERGSTPGLGHQCQATGARVHPPWGKDKGSPQIHGGLPSARTVRVCPGWERWSQTGGGQGRRGGSQQPCDQAMGDVCPREAGGGHAQGAVSATLLGDQR